MRPRTWVCIDRTTSPRSVHCAACPHPVAGRRTGGCRGPRSPGRRRWPRRRHDVGPTPCEDPQRSRPGPDARGAARRRRGRGVEDVPGVPEATGGPPGPGPGSATPASTNERAGRDQHGRATRRGAPRCSARWAGRRRRARGGGRDAAHSPRRRPRPGRRSSTGRQARRAGGTLEDGAAWTSAWPGSARTRSSTSPPGTCSARCTPASSTAPPDDRAAPRAPARVHRGKRTEPRRASRRRRRRAGHRRRPRRQDHLPRPGPAGRLPDRPAARTTSRSSTTCAASRRR